MKTFKIGLLFFLLVAARTFSQSLPIEAFGGDKKASIDLLYINYVKNQKDENSTFLFFNRNRALLDYEMTQTENLPQFTFTEAISYNLKSLKGLAPVFVTQLNNKGIYPKTGIQYLRKNKSVTLFGWSVIDLLKNPNLDVFLLAQYTPKINSKLKLYTRVESLSTIPTRSEGTLALTQRLRLGLQRNKVSFGLASDSNEIGRTDFKTQLNSGIFLRNEF